MINLQGQIVFILNKFPTDIIQYKDMHRKPRAYKVCESFKIKSSQKINHVKHGNNN